MLGYMLKFYGHQYLEGLVVEESLNIGHAVGSSLDAESRKQLVLRIEEHLAATVNLVAIPRNVEPTGVDHVV
jgi:hypothetical protein